MANYNNSTSNAGGSSVVVSDEHPGYISGIEYCTDDIQGSSNTSNAQSVNSILFQYYLYNGQPLDRFNLELVSVGAATPVLQVGIYKTFNGLPAERIYYNSTDLTGFSAGFLDYDMTNESLEPGWYAIGTSLTVSCSFRMNNTSNRALIANRYGFLSNSLILQSGIRYTFDSTNELPLNFDASNYTRTTCTQSPLIRYIYQ